MHPTPPPTPEGMSATPRKAITNIFIGGIEGAVFNLQGSRSILYSEYTDH